MASLKQIQAGYSYTYYLHQNNIMLIESDRLVLRNALPTDTPAIYKLHMLPETVKYNPSGYPESEASNQKLVNEWCSQATQQTRNSYTLIIERKADQKFIGIISLDLHKPSYRKGEVWYKLEPAEWGMGYATECLRAVISYGFRELGLHRIESGCSIHNIPSYRVMEKAGMTREGTNRKVLPLADGWHDAYFYSILEDELL